MKKILAIFVVLFAWSQFTVVQAQFDPYVLIKTSNSVVDSVIGPNNNTGAVYFPFLDNNTGTLFDSVLVVVEWSDISGIDSIAIGFDFSPDNTNWIATFKDSVELGASANTSWVTAKPSNTARVDNLPFPRYGRFVFWGKMTTGATDTTSIDSWKIYGYHKPTTINIIR